jgi:hypothetical protein
MKVDIGEKLEVCGVGMWVMKIDKAGKVRNKYIEGGGMETSVT